MDDALPHYAVKQTTSRTAMATYGHSRVLEWCRTALSQADELKKDHHSLGSRLNELETQTLQLSVCRVSRSTRQLTHPKCRLGMPCRRQCYHHQHLASLPMQCDGMSMQWVGMHPRRSRYIQDTEALSTPQELTADPLVPHSLEDLDPSAHATLSKRVLVCAWRGDWFETQPPCIYHYARSSCTA